MLLLVGACGTTDPGGPSNATDDDLTGTLTVLAAASLTDVFERIGAGFEAEHPGVEVTFSFSGSSGLAAQVVAGAPADVFAAASPATMARVTDAGLADAPPRVFARNRLQLVVPAGNPGEVAGLADLAEPARVVALCAPEVPCGAAAERLFAAAGLTPAPDTLESDVRAVLTKVRLGEVDAGLVYRTDLLAAGDDVQGIDIPQSAEAVNDYPIAVLRDAPSPGAARAFVDYVLAPSGQAALADAGFDAP